MRKLALSTVKCNLMSTGCLVNAAEYSNVKAVGCNLHVRLNCLPCTFNAKPVSMLKCYGHESEECIFIDFSFVQNNYKMFSASEAASNSSEQVVLLNERYVWVCFLLSFCFNLLILSCTWFKVTMIVIKCVLPRVVSTACWMVCLTIKKEKWLSNIS